MNSIIVDKSPVYKPGDYFQSPDGHTYLLGQHSDSKGTYRLLNLNTYKYTVAEDSIFLLMYNYKLTYVGNSAEIRITNI